MNIKIDHLNMTVNDLSQSEAWYTRVFGFQRVEGGVRNGRPWAILRNGDALLCLYQDPKRTAPLGGDGPAHEIAHFGIRIDDAQLPRWLAVLEQERLPLGYGGVIDYPHSRSWYVSDPTGHEIEVSHWAGGLRFGD